MNNLINMRAGMIRSSGREAIQLFNGLRGIYLADIDAVGLKMNINEKKKSFFHCDRSAPQTSTPRVTCCVIKKNISKPIKAK